MRFKLAFRTAFACIVSMNIGMALELSGTSLAALFPLMLLSPMSTCTWRNMGTRIAVLGLSAVIAPSVAGLLLDAAWSFIPVAFFLLFVTNVLAPLAKAPVLFMASATVVTSVVIDGAFDYTLLTLTAVDTSLSLGVAVVVSTVFARTFWPDDPHQTLAAQLAESYDIARARIQAALDAQLADEPPPPAPEPKIPVGLAANVNALANCQKQNSKVAPGMSGRGMMVMTAQRVLMLTVDLELASKIRLPDAARRGIAAELRAMQSALGVALTAFSARAHAGFAGVSGRPDAEELIHWPDFPNLLRRLSAAWRPVRASLYSGSQEDRKARIAFGTTLGGMKELAQELRAPPNQLICEQKPQTAPRTHLARRPQFSLARADVQAAIRGSVATVIAIIAVLFAGDPSYVTAAWTALLVIQSSYGAIIRKSILRFVGALAGGALAVLVMTAVSSNAEGLFPYLFAGWLISAAADYGGRGSPQVAYGFLQMGISYFICVVTLGPSANTDEVFSRLWGILMGLAATFLVFQFMSRDYAGNQLLRALSHIINPLPKLVVVPMGDPLALNAISKANASMLSSFTEVLRLVDEAAFEGHRSGADNRAALTTTSRARWVGAHVAAVADARSKQTPHGTPALVRAAADALAEASAEWLQNCLDILCKTEGLGQPNTRKRKRGTPLILAIGRRPLPALEPLVQALHRAHEQAEPEFRTWSTERGETLASELLHLHQLASQLPGLREAALLTCTPGAKTSARHQPSLAAAR